MVIRVLLGISWILLKFDFLDMRLFIGLHVWDHSPISATLCLGESIRLTQKSVILSGVWRILPNAVEGSAVCKSQK